MTTEVHAARPRFLVPASRLAEAIGQAGGWVGLAGRLAVAVVLVLLARLNVPFGPLEQALGVVALGYLIYLPGELALAVLRVDRQPLALTIAMRMTLGVAVYAVVLYPLQRVQANWLAVDITLACSFLLLFFSAVLRQPEALRWRWPSVGRIDVPRALPYVAALFTLGVIVVLLLADGRRNEDVWPRISTIREYVENGALVHVGSPREDLNAWPALWAWIGRLTDIDPIPLYNTYMPPLLGLLTVVSFMALSQTLFGRLRPAVLATVLFTLTVLVQPDTDLFGNIAEDKVYVSTCAFFVAQALALLYASSGNRGYLAGLAAILFGTFLIHPAMAAPAAILVGVTLAIVARAHIVKLLKEPGALAALALVTIVGLIASFLSFADLRSGGAAWFEVGDQTRNIVRLGGDWYIVDTEQLAHPVIQLSLLATPLYLLRARHDRRALFLAGQNLAIVLLSFTPVATAALNPFLTSVGVTRIVWFLPSALGVAYVLELLLARLRLIRGNNAHLVSNIAGTAAFAFVLLVVAREAVPEAEHRWEARDRTRREVDGLAELAQLAETLPRGVTLVTPVELGDILPAFTGHVSGISKPSGAIEIPADVEARLQDISAFYSDKRPTLAELNVLALRHDLNYFALRAKWLGCKGEGEVTGAPYALGEVTDDQSLLIRTSEGTVISLPFVSDDTLRKIDCST